MIILWRTARQRHHGSNAAHFVGPDVTRVRCHRAVVANAGRGCVAIQAGEVFQIEDPYGRTARLTKAIPVNSSAGNDSRDRSTAILDNP